MTLNTFHLAGVATKSNVTRGVPRLDELLSITREPENPSCTVYLHKDDETDNSKAIEIMQRLSHTRLRQIVRNIEICFDPDDMNTLIEEDTLIIKQYNYYTNMLDECNDEEAKDDNAGNQNGLFAWRLTQRMLEHGLSMDDVYFARRTLMVMICLAFTDYNSDNLAFRIRKLDISSQSKHQSKSLDQSDDIYMLKTFQDTLLDNLVLRGVKDIRHATIRKVTDSLTYKDGTYSKTPSWVIDTVGSNLVELLGLDYVDWRRIITNDIREVYSVLGIEAARQAIFDEISEVLDFEGTYINYHHLTLLCDRMTYNFYDKHFQTWY